LNIKGTVIPVSYTDTNLEAEYEDGSTTHEEHLIDEPGDDNRDGKLRIVRAWLKPKAKANPDATEAIQSADMIVVGPGDLYTSIIPNFLVSGIQQAMWKSDAKKVYILNLMTKWGQTYNYTARDHIETLEKYMGTSFDCVVVNNSSFAPKALAHYAKVEEYPVVDDLPKTSSYKIIRSDVASREHIASHKNDTLTRSLIRHDSTKLAAVLMKYINRNV
jgi:uncharacterized cofD-like protein